MTAEELKKQYNYYKQKITQLEKKIKNEKTKEIEIVPGKVKGSSDVFPYGERRFSVQMYQPEAHDASVGKITVCNAEIKLLQQKVDAVDCFIAGIEDEQTKDIFTHYVVDNLSQQEVAEMIGYTQARVSQLMKQGLKDL